ncbi:acetyl-CoA hydrolase/transferase family protein [Thermanaerovibrio acidaminovorans]|uniref:acetyl-CoA hydrolase/transferase family protein n=1 Tax=Thermanaerovibrio acidaminovorans TaxID=81462 RepID=UPI00249309F6|nr:acetyl-CoA hydrolase/transferase family protein [Thermanaerovibrio acidaminovorans]
MKTVALDIRDRVRCESLRSLIMDPHEAAKLINDGDVIGASGFTPSGYPKEVPMAIARRKLETGSPSNLTLWCGASVGPELDGELTASGALARRFPYQTDDRLRKAINEGTVLFQDIHLSHSTQNLRYGFYGKMDVAIVEAVAINQDGSIVPSTSVGNSPTFVKMAEKVIVEVNVTQPMSLEGVHDIYIPGDPPSREPIPIASVSDRIGTPFIPCDPSKIVAIVPSDVPDKQRPLAAVDEVSARMARNLLDFLDVEVKAQRLPRDLFPLQSGVGEVANAVLAGFLEWPSENLRMYTEVIQDSMLDLIDAGKVSFASGTSFTPSPEGARRMYANMDLYRQRVILRPQEISNHPEVIRRLGVIAMNTAVEVDVYGHVNSTMALGSKMINGIGGSGDFARNGYLTVFLTPSTAKGGSISRIVPFCSHVDHTEHDVDVVVTEWGVADLRGLTPRERSVEIVGKCAHPDYRSALMDYIRRAQANGGHEPHDLKEAFSFHLRLIRNGSMLPVGGVRES